MLIRNEKICDDVLLGIRKICDDKDLLISNLPIGQREHVAEQIGKMRAERRIVEWLNTRVLLFEMLGEEKIIRNHPSGRPFLKDKSYRISISHTHGYVAILLSNKYYVGIDIETISNRVARVVDKFISPEEYINPSNEIIHQLLHWSAKETLFKIMKESNIDFKEHLRVLPFEPLSRGVFDAREYKTNKQKTFKINYEVLYDAVLTWAVDR